MKRKKSKTVRCVTYLETRGWRVCTREHYERLTIAYIVATSPGKPNIKMEQMNEHDLVQSH